MSFMRSPTIMPLTSAPVMMPRTPGSFAALLVSMLTMRAWGRDVRNIFAANAAGKLRSAA